MSLVIGFITNDQAFMFSDGRARNRDTKIIINEKCNKTRKINKNVIIGFTGCLEFAEKILEYFYTRNDIDSIHNMTADNVAYELLSAAKFIYEVNKSALKITITIAGINSNNDIGLYTTGSDYNFEMNTLIATEGIFHFSTASPEGNEKYSTYFEQCLCSGMNLTTAISKTYLYASQLDESINTTIFHQNIQKTYK